ELGQPRADRPEPDDPQRLPRALVETEAAPFPALLLPLVGAEPLERVEDRADHELGDRVRVYPDRLRHQVTGLVERHLPDPVDPGAQEVDPAEAREPFDHLGEPGERGTEQYLRSSILPRLFGRRRAVEASAFELGDPARDQ